MSNYEKKKQPIPNQQNPNHIKQNQLIQKPYTKERTDIKPYIKEPSDVKPYIKEPTDVKTIKKTTNGCRTMKTRGN